MLWQLFWSFVKIGCVSFGGGYAMIPLIESEVIRHGWIPVRDLVQIVTISGMSPGPIATNIATMVGYRTAGFPGAVVATLGTTLPSVLIVLLLSMFLYRLHRTDWFEAVFYGLRPVVASLIIFAGIRYGMINGIAPAWEWPFMAYATIFALSLFLLIKFRVHPLLLLLSSGVAGILLFS